MRICHSREGPREGDTRVREPVGFSFGPGSSFARNPTAFQAMVAQSVSLLFPRLLIFLPQGSNIHLPQISAFHRTKI
jgi:hypothetical protein